MRGANKAVGGGVFVAGTDTGVGKTVVAAAIARTVREHGFSVGVMKPFQTGATPTSNGWFAPDAEFLMAAAQSTDPIELVCPVVLEAPLAPSVAAELVGRHVSIDDVMPAFRTLSAAHEFVVVEAAGGLAVPIDGNSTMRDLAVAINLPVIIVARPGLGTINHTHLTVEYARAAGLTILGIVISNYPAEPGLAERTNPAAIEQITGLPVLAKLEHDPNVDTELGIQSETPEGREIIRLLDAILQSIYAK